MADQSLAAGDREGGRRVPDSSQRPATVTGWSVVRLVATREVRERSKARSFRVTAVIGVLITVAIIALPKVLAGPKHPYRIGVVGALSDTAQRSIPALSGLLGRPIVMVAEPDGKTAEAALRAKKLALAIIASSELVVRQTPQRNDTSSTARLAATIASVLREDNGLRAVGLGNAQVSAVDGFPPPQVRGLLPNHAGRDRQRAVTLAGVVGLYAFLSIFAAWVLYGVVEEKSSRVVEVLLSTIRPGELLCGKVLGIGIMAVGQAVLIAVSAFAAASATGSNVLRGAAGTEVLIMVGWLVLGYAFYCWVYAAAGSLVSRQEEVQNIAFPIQLPLLVAYGFSFPALITGNVSPVSKVLSFLPPTAPISMPVRLAAGPVPAWQVILSVVLSIAGTVLMARFASVVYVRAILRTGRRLRLSEVLRG